MKFVPFTVHVSVVPDRPGKKFEYLGSLAKLAVLAQDALSKIAGVDIATPGGGQSVQFSDINVRDGLGSFAGGTAAKPQFGDSPSQLMLTGFYESSAANAPRYSDRQIFSGGTIYTGNGAHNNDSVPTSTVTNEVKTLKAALLAALTAELPAGTVFDIFRIDYQGIVYGDKGFHFPQ